MRIWNMMAPHACVAAEIQGILQLQMCPPEEQGVSASCWAPQPRNPVLARGAHIISGCDNQWGSCLGKMEGCWKPWHPLKEPTHKLSLGGTHLGLWWRDSDSGGTWDINGETELCGFRARDSCHGFCVEPSAHMANSESTLVWWTSLASSWCFGDSALPKCMPEDILVATSLGLHCNLS